MALVMEWALLVDSWAVKNNKVDLSILYSCNIQGSIVENGIDEGKFCMLVIVGILWSRPRGQFAPG